MPRTPRGPQPGGERPPVVLPPPPSSPGFQIHIADASGTIISRLTDGLTPAWSRDGQRIAFMRDGQIHAINVDGSNDVTLAAGIDPSWSPGDSLIAFRSTEGISVMKADGSGVRTLIRHDFRTDTWIDDMGVGKPAWSPDGSLIAFEHLGDGDIQPAQVFVMNADGSNVRRFTVTMNGARFAESDPAWSPDGSKLAYWCYCGGLVVASVKDGVPQSLYSNFPFVAYGTKPAWSPDGRTIAFNAGRFTGSPAIWTIPSARGSLTLLAANAYDPAWSPDGARIAFTRQYD